MFSAVEAVIYEWSSLLALGFGVVSVVSCSSLPSDVFQDVLASRIVSVHLLGERSRVKMCLTTHWQLHLLQPTAINSFHLRNWVVECMFLVPSHQVARMVGAVQYIFGCAPAGLSSISVLIGL